jgi:hypothetical protein
VLEFDYREGTVGADLGILREFGGCRWLITRARQYVCTAGRRCTDDAETSWDACNHVWVRFSDWESEGEALGME